MDERDRERLADMLRYAETAVRILGRLDADGLSASEEKFLAAVRCLQNIGEAARKVSDATRSDLPAIPWRRVIGMRHRLVHGYEDIRVEIIVQTIREDLPELVSTIRSALRDNAP